MQVHAADALLATLSTLRPLLAQGGEIAIFPMLRARDYACTVRGTVAHMGLASASSFDPSGYGRYRTLSGGPVYVVQGTLLESHLPQLLPLMEKLARAKEELLLAADDIDPGLLATLVINDARGALRSVVLTSRMPGPDALSLLARLAGATPGRADTDVTLGSPGTLKDVIATTEIAVVRDPHATGLVGLLYVAGEDLPEATTRARAAAAIVREWKEGR